MQFNAMKGRARLLAALGTVSIVIGSCAGGGPQQALLPGPGPARGSALAMEQTAPAAPAKEEPADAYQEPVLALPVKAIIAPELVLVAPRVEQPAASPESRSNRPVAPAVQEFVARQGLIQLEENALSRERWTSNPTPWDRGHIGRYMTSLNRAEDRAASLAARAARRSFEGAPPAMPHSQSFGTGSKTCMDCHYTGMRLGTRVAHPMSHVPMSNCTQCHVELDNKLFDELITPGNTFEGFRPARKGLTTMEGAPPMMPHGTHMRTACLSCHGEYGYPGLKTDHPSRSNCMQCHIAVR